MKRTNRKKNRILIILSLIATMLVMGAQLASAEVVSQMPDLEYDTSSLLITMQNTDENVNTTIKGFHLTLYKVADVKVKNGNVDYTATEQFKGVPVDYNSLTVESSIAAAKDLYDYAAQNKIEGITKISDANGEVDFGQVDNGMYLIAQTAATDDALKYEALKPYIIMAPQQLTELGYFEWEYEVESIPKTQVKGSFDPPTPPPPPGGDDDDEGKEQSKVKGAKTGDYANVMIWSLSIVITICIIAILMIRRRRRSND